MRRRKYRTTTNRSSHYIGSTTVWPGQTERACQSTRACCSMRFCHGLRSTRYILTSISAFHQHFGSFISLFPFLNQDILVQYGPFLPGISYIHLRKSLMLHYRKQLSIFQSDRITLIPSSRLFSALTGRERQRKDKPKHKQSEKKRKARMLTRSRGLQASSPICSRNLHPENHIWN